MNPNIRCRLTSLGLGEPLRATATHAPAWLLLEHPGPWGHKALEGGRLPAGLATPLARSSTEAGVRVNLIRRHGRGGGGGTHVFLANPAEGWIEGAVLDDPHEVLGLDLAALARGERPSRDGSAGPTRKLAGNPTGERFREHEGPLFLVCAHGRHDPCCAENGRPVARALAARFPARTWETTHLGGDRFSANMVCFPHGLYFGRVPPEQAADIASAYRDGEIRLDRYRGRCCWPGPVQAAEFWVREETGRTGIADVRLTGTRVDGDVTTATFAVAGPGTGGEGEEPYEVRVRQRLDPKARLLSCHAEDASCPTAYELVALGAPREGTSGGLR